jgi:hypothetical protein
MNTTNSYVVGKTAVLTGTFQNPATLAGLTPTTMTLRILDPAGIETDMTSGFSNPAPGIYTALFVVRLVGLHSYRFEVTAPFYDACQNVFVGLPSAFPSPV